jgi:hypothetical protein
MPNLARRTVVACFAFVALAAIASAADETERVSRSAKLPAGGLVRVKNFSGRVVIVGEDIDDVEIEAIRTAPQERLRHITLDVRAEGDTVVVDANHRDSWWFGFHNDVVHTDMTVRVPRQARLEVSVFSSAVEIRGVRGAQSVHTFSGGVELENVAGPIEAHTFSGRVLIRESSWPSDETIEIHTHSGSVEVLVPETAHGRVSFHSFSGRLTSDVPLTLRTTSRRALDATLGSDAGRSTLQFSTFSGNVVIRSARP